MLYLVGIADDLVGVRYMAKFIVQILCGVFLIAGGIWLDNLHGVFGIYELSPYIGYPLTVLVVVFVINAINLIDGIRRPCVRSEQCGDAYIRSVVFRHQTLYLFISGVFGAWRVGAVLLL